MTPLVVFTLVLVILSDGGTTSYSRDFQTLDACEMAEAAAHDAATRAIGVLDVGTLCIRSDFDPLIKPRA